jgi:uncharacterized protein YaiE (UPF0345 family)
MKELQGPGMTLRIIRDDPEVLEMEAAYAGTGPMPPEHLHPSQAERFEVLEGTLRALIGGEERLYHAGDIFDVPAGTPHTMSATEPTRTNWQVRPALRTAEFFERLFSGEPGDLLNDFSAEFRLTAR